MGRKFIGMASLNTRSYIFLGFFFLFFFLPFALGVGVFRRLGVMLSHRFHGFMALVFLI